MINYLVWVGLPVQLVAKLASWFLLIFKMRFDAAEPCSFVERGNVKKDQTRRHFMFAARRVGPIDAIFKGSDEVPGLADTY
jgi:hypothetical protein